MKSILCIVSLIICSVACSQPSATTQTSNDRIVGGSCEGCEALLEYGSKSLGPIDTLPDYSETGPKLIVQGTIYKKDGKTPAPGVILYIYHTDQNGIYPTKGNETGWDKRHGYLRGWIKTDATGKYTFYTLKPAAYPDNKIPAHIHATLKEPDTNAYWIDEYLFEDDPYLTKEERSRQEKRGGNGIISLSKGKNGVLVAQRDIILGLNIPAY